jgi:hypothetical protein
MWCFEAVRLGVIIQSSVWKQERKEVSTPTFIGQRYEEKLLQKLRRAK